MACTTSTSEVDKTALCSRCAGADGISLFTAVEKQLGLKLEVQNVSDYFVRD